MLNKDSHKSGALKITDDKYLSYCASKHKNAPKNGSNKAKKSKNGVKSNSEKYEKYIKSGYTLKSKLSRKSYKSGQDNVNISKFILDKTAPS